MAQDLDGSTSYIEATSAVVTAVPLTIAAWFNPDSATVGQTIVGVTASGATNARFTLQCQSTGPLRAAVQAGATVAGADSSINVTAATWQHGAAVFTSNTSRTAYLDGGNSGTNTTNVTPSAAALNRTTIGTQWRNQVREAFFGGLVAEVGIWNVALDAAEIASLARGFKPTKIRPNALLFYAPIIREIADYARGITLSQVATTVATHHRRYG